jgi:hypothetical protein
MSQSSLLALNLSDIITTAKTRCFGALKNKATSLPTLDPQSIKKTLILLPSLLFKPKIGGLLISLFIVVMPIGKDWAFTTLWGRQIALDTKIAIQQAVNTQKEAELKQFSIWKEQLKGLHNDIIVLEEGQSAKVLATSELSRLISFAKGNNRDPQLGPALPAPHTHRHFISMTPNGSRIVNLLANDPQSVASPDSQPSMPMNATAPIPQRGPVPMGLTGMPNAQQALNKLNAWRFDYELTLQGTYAGLIDALNEWIHYQHLVVFRAISIKPVDGQLVYVDSPKLVPPGRKEGNTSGDNIKASLTIPTFSFMDGTPAKRAEALMTKADGKETSNVTSNKDLAPVTNGAEDEVSELRRPTGASAPLQMTVAFSIYLFDPAIQAQEPDPEPAGA